MQSEPVVRRKRIVFIRPAGVAPFFFWLASHASLTGK